MLKLINFIILSLFLFSCGKGADFKSEVVHDKDFYKRAKFCKKVDLYNNPLDKENTLNVFKCFNWDKNYKKLVKHIEESDEQEWNHLVAPFNEAYFGNKESRDKFLKTVAKLNEENGFENLNSFVKVFFKNENFFNFLISITSQKHKYRGQLISLMEDKVVSLQEVTPGLEAYKYFTKSVFKHREQLTQDFKNLNKGDKYFKTLIPVVDQIADFFAGKELETYSYAIKNFANYDKYPWFLSLLNKGLSRKDFVDSMFFVKNNYPEISSDFEVLNNILDKNLVCDGSTDEYKFSINTEYEMENKVNALLSFNEIVFWQELIDARAKIVTFNNFCEPTINGEKIENLMPIIDRIHNRSELFFKNPINFHSMAYLHNVVNDPKKVSSKFNIVKLIDSDFTKAYINLVDFVHQVEPSFMGTLFDVASDLGLSFFFKLDEFHEMAFKQDNYRLFNTMGEFWQGFSEKEKLVLLKLLEYQFDTRFDFHKIVKYYQEFFKLNDSFDKIIYDNYFNTKEQSEYTLNLLHNHISKMKDQKLLDELSSFLSKDSLLMLFEFFSKGIPLDLEGESEVAPEIVKFENTSIALKKSVRECLDEVTSSLNINQDFYVNVFNIPNSCRSHFSGKLVFDSMIALQEINEVFKVKYQQDLIGPSKLLSPQMMRDIFSSIVGMQFYFEHNNVIEKSLEEIIKPLREFLFDKGHSKLFDNLVKILNRANKIDPTLTNKLIVESLRMNLSTKERSKLFWSILEDAVDTNIDIYTYNCEDLIGDYDGNKCATKEIVKEKILAIVDLLLEKTDSENQILEEIINLFRKDIGIRIPRKKKPKKQKKYSLSLINFGKMLTDSYRSRQYEVNYYLENASYKTNSSVLTRTEAIIKDIGFLDNFYGAFFMNKVSSSKNYVKQIKRLKANVRLMRNTGNFFRKIGVFPESTRWQLSSILETYDGLWEAGEIGYADQLQATLALVSMTSPKKNQDFQPMRVPKVEKVAGHKGRLLTRLSEIRGLSHLAAKFESAYVKDGVYSPDEKLKEISDNFLMIFSEKKLKKTLRDIADNNKESITELTATMIDTLFDFDTEARAYLGSAIWDSLYIMHSIYGEEEADFVLDYAQRMFDLIVDLNKKIKVDKEDSKRLLKLMSKSLRSLASKIHEPKIANEVKLMIKEAFEDLNMVDALGVFVSDNFIIKKFEQLISDIAKASKDITKEKLIFKSMKEYSSSKHFNNAALVEWVDNNSLNNNDYLNNLVDYLSQESSAASKSNMIRVVEFFISENPKRTEQFLREINNSVTFDSR